MKAWILVGGRLVLTPEVERQRQDPAPFVAAADGGIEHALTLGVTPDLWVGDFDSSDDADPRFATLQRQTVPRDKDFTDAELAVQLARERGATALTFWGAFGGRFDHTLALALLALRLATEGVAVTLHSGDESAAPLLPGEPLALRALPGQILSILALDPLSGLSISGVRWPLERVSVPVGSGWTVSNEAAGKQITVSVDTGRGLVVQLWPATQGNSFH